MRPWSVVALPEIMSEIIRFENACFSYDGRAVLKNFNLRIEGGEAVLLEGPNGCGKTTLLKVINGLRFLSEGSYYFDGTLIDETFLKNDKNRKNFHQRIGYSFQNPDVQLFNPDVYSEVAFGPRQMGFSDAEIKERVQDAMALLDVSGLSDRVPYHLSGGEKRRVAIASILSVNPEVIVLDEPTNDLDRDSTSNLLRLLKKLKEAGKTLVLVSHDLSLAEIADTIVKM